MNPPARQAHTPTATIEAPCVISLNGGNVSGLNAKTNTTWRPAASAALWILFTLLGGIALAHPVAVLGTLRSNPQTPQVNEVFTLTLSLQEPDGLHVENARILAEFQHPTTNEIITAQFSETESMGVYRTNLRLPSGGRWSLQLSVATSHTDETVATTQFRLMPQENKPSMSLVFPPAGTSSSALRRWLVWVVGLPLLAGLGVTLLVLNGKRHPPSAEHASSQ